MQEINQSQQNNNDEISLKELILKIKEWYQYLLSKWKNIFLAGILGGILGFTYAYFKKPIYTAETTFVLEEGESGGGSLGGFSGLASIAGIDLGGGGGGIFQGDNILQLYKSRRMIQETLLSIDTFDNKTQSLIERYIEFNELRKGWVEKPELVNIKFENKEFRFSRTQDSVITMIVNDINNNYLEVTKPDKKLSIIAVKIKAKDEAFAKSFTENIVKTVNEFYIHTKTKKSAENLFILQFQADSIKRVLNSSISGVASAIDANPNSNPAFQTLRVPSQRKQLDVQANGAAYQEILKNLELAKITFRKDKPLIQVIDEPIFPLKMETLGKVKAIILGILIIGFLSIVFFLIKKILSEVLI